MNMVNTVVNGYITVIVLILFLAFYSPLAGGNWLMAGVLLICPIPPSVGGTQPPKCAYPSKAQDDMVEKFHRVSARDAGGESL